MQRMVRGRVSDIATHESNQRIERQPVDGADCFERGLYSRRRGIQELQEWSNTFGPGGFVVLGALDTLVLQIVAEAPTFFQKHVAKALDVLHDARPFAGADVEPNSRTRLRIGVGCKTADASLVPPHRRRQGGNFSKYLRQLEAHIKRDQCS